jgi:hypothetical protein
MADVQKYYDENRSHFDSPERIQIWRILLPTQADADAVLSPRSASRPDRR